MPKIKVPSAWSSVVSESMPRTDGQVSLDLSAFMSPDRRSFTNDEQHVLAVAVEKACELVHAALYATFGDAASRITIGGTLIIEPTPLGD